MRATRTITLTVFTAGVAFAMLSFLYPAQAQHIDFVKGVVFDKEIDSQQKYKDTLLKYFEPDKNWQPVNKTGTAHQPEINGIAGVIVEMESGKVLFEKNATQQMPVASLVKVMTAILAVEHKALDSRIYISSNAASIGENTMGLAAGETYTLEELLYGLFMHSGNDAAYAISEGVAGNSQRFVEWMNFKAKELGMADTYFADPSGLNDKSYSTPADLVKLTRYALNFTELKSIAATLEKNLYSDSHAFVSLYNQTNLLSSYPGVKGFKTGYTEEAGLCLITYAENEGKEIVGVVLNSLDRKGDMILMLDHSFATLGISVQHNLL